MTRSVFTKSYERFRKMLADARKASGLSQAEVAARLRRPQTFVSKYERGERRVDVVEFLEIARALDFDPIGFIRRLDGR